MTKSLLLAASLLAATLSCSPKSSKNYLPPLNDEKTVTDGDASDVFDPKADILFVIDNSGSMDPHQRNLARNIDLFTSVFLKSSIIDYNIGVISTDTEGYYRPQCCGKLIGNTRIVTKRTPNAGVVLQNNLMIGTQGGGTEAPFEAIQEALSPNLLNSWNAGFIRDPAALIVIFITDAEDQSRGVYGRDLMATLLNLKKGDKTKVLSYGAIIPSSERGCQRDDLQTPVKIEEFLKIVPNGGNNDNIVSLCATDYGQRLAEFALQIVDKVSSRIFLSRLPDPKTLKVIYGTAELPMDIKKGWSYSPSMNAILLGEDIDWASQPPGSKIEVHYREARG